ncbi:MAG: polysaccharide deacetylase family protein [Rhodospirillales bacterium]
MTVRDAIAWPWWAGHMLGRCLSLSRPMPGAFRILLIHDVPRRCISAFECLIAEIAATNGFITPVEVEARLTGNSRSTSGDHVPYLLTFDDGYVTHDDLARTVLAHHGISAIFFVCPGLIDLPADEQPAAIAHHIYADTITIADVARRKLSLMSWEAVTALRKMGHTIGAHTLTHASLAALHGDALRQEVKGSRDRIAEATGEIPLWFASPYGEIDTIDRDALAVVGEHFRFCRSGVRGLNTPDTHRLGLLGESIDLSAGRAWQKLEITGALDFRYRTARRRLSAMLEGMS